MLRRLNSTDLSVYLVADSSFCHPCSYAEVLEQALDNGVKVIQVRNKRSLEQLEAEVLQAVRLAEPFGATIIVNDSTDVSQQCCAHGVHVGQQDADPTLVRQLLGEDIVLGLSILNEAQLIKVPTIAVDYLGIGPVFPTASKDDVGPALGLQFFSELCAKASLPVVGISGINLSNAHQVFAAGAQGIAVLSAICSAEKPAVACRELLKIAQLARG